ncbi:MAG TPA: GNAT family N-acetyltransferase [Gemmata sp.]|jgi:RimJ/RimL family protein N-acetyltransferase|nr:GNAT family N-acetyltransferase [Gemmata sp.]
MMDVFLETDRLILRRFTDTDEDASLLYELDSDPEVMRYIGPFALGGIEAYRERLRTFWLPYYAAHPARGFWATIEKSTNQFIGWIFLRPSTDYRFAGEAGWTRSTDIEIGYRFRRTAWGRGLASEVATVLVRLALDDPAVTCVVSYALIPNRGSTRVMEKAGLSRVREFTLSTYTDPGVMYAACREGCSPV